MYKNKKLCIINTCICNKTNRQWQHTEGNIWITCDRGLTLKIHTYTIKQCLKDQNGQRACTTEHAHTTNGFKTLKKVFKRKQINCISSILNW